MSAYPTLTDRVQQHLDATPAGACNDEMAALFGVTTQALGNVTVKMQQAGRIKAHPEPKGKANARKRYFSPQHWKASPHMPKPARVSGAIRRRGEPFTGVPKVTICPSCADARFTPERVERYFSGLTPGSYPPSDSVIARIHP